MEANENKKLSAHYVENHNQSKRRIGEPNQVPMGTSIKQRCPEDLAQIAEDGVGRL